MLFSLVLVLVEEERIFLFLGVLVFVGCLYILEFLFMMLLSDLLDVEFKLFLFVRVVLLFLLLTIGEDVVLDLLVLVLYVVLFT